MEISWDLIRSFRAVAQTGSASAAARQLGLTQPTLTRHIDLLEEALHLQLFTRGRAGMALTEHGARLVQEAGAMSDSATAFARRASGLEDTARGTVRISANEIFGALLLPGLLAPILHAHPGLQVELAVDNSAANLLRRDADIALRLFRPTQNDLVARKLADLPLGLFAHDSYLSQAGAPETPQALRDHSFIGFDREPGLIRAAAAVGLTLSPADFAFRSDSILAHIAAIRGGVGIGVTHAGLAARWPGVRRVLPDLALPALPLWLACHADVRFNARVRLTMDALARALRDPYAAYAP